MSTLLGHCEAAHEANHLNHEHLASTAASKCLKTVRLLSWKVDLCLQDLASRIQKLQELKSNDTKQCENLSLIQCWPENTDKEINTGMDMA